MPRKLIILITAIFTLIVGGIFAYFYSQSKSLQNGQPNDSNTGNFFSNLFPFGDSGTITIPQNPNDQQEGEDLSNVEAPNLRKVTNAAVAGAVVFERKVDEKENSQEFIRYIEMGTGHIYEAATETLQNTRVSNATIPKIREALWLSTGDSVYIRYLENDESITTFLANIEINEEGEALLSGSFLPQNVRSLSLSPKEDKIFYTTTDESGAKGVVASLDGKKGEEIFESPFTYWHSIWNQNTITLLSAPTAIFSGIAESLNPTTRSLTQIATGQSGFQILPSTDAKFLVSKNSDGTVLTTVLENNAEKLLPIRTLPEKCVWSNKETHIVYCAVPTKLPEGEYPDDWYKGLISFRDGIWKINTETQSAELMSLISEVAGVDIDATNLSLAPQEDFIAFINKSDGSLWSLRLVD